MDLFEYQAKELFSSYGVPVPAGRVATTPATAAAIATEIADGGSPKVVVKAQVKTGGRGKAGGVLVVDAAEADEAAARILGMDIKGHVVHAVLVEPASDIAAEYYLSFLLDRSRRSYLAMCSVEGGMDIEELAVTHPDRLARLTIDPLVGVDAGLAREIARQGRLPDDVLDEAAAVIVSLWACLVGADATLVEVNPLVRTGNGRIVALDGKVTLDDNARFRHPERADLVDRADVDPLERRARDKHLNYVKLDGQVGIIGNGAGLVMATLDVVAQAGERFGGVAPANFLDIGGGASAQVMADGLEIVLADPAVRAVLVNVFGGITACDAVARGIVDALAMLSARGEPVRVPLVCRLDGNNAQQGREILRDSAAGAVEIVETMDDAAARVAALAGAS